MKFRRVEVLFAIVIFAVIAGILVLPVASSPLSNESPAGTVRLTPLAGPDRPANVPMGYVITPAGYFHPSCVQSLSKGERLLADGRLQHADGSVENAPAVCSYPRYLANGMPVSSGETKAGPGAGMRKPEISGWVEDANVTTGSTGKAYGGMFAVWQVPPGPPKNDGQVLYYFPGFEDINDANTSILQPVLGWYEGQWTIASWNCCLNGIVTNSPAVNVAPGDLIYGSVTSNCASGTLSCKTWNVLTLDLLSGESTTLGNTPSDGQRFNWAFGGVLEAYYIGACDDYPSNRQTTFYAVTVFDENRHVVKDPKWETGIDSTDTPQCHYAVKPAPNEVSLDY